MNKIIAVDFDGTLCQSAYPQIGKPRKRIIRKLKKEIQKGAKVILWTCRTGELLKEAEAFCCEHNISLSAVNENLPERMRQFGNDPRKIGADEYWDDRAVKV